MHREPNCTTNWDSQARKYQSTTCRPGASVPFVHSHKQNEEIYGVLNGKAVMTLDGEPVELNAGDWLRVAPSVKRQLAAAADSAVSYICIQVKEGSLEQMTATDAVI